MTGPDIHVRQLTDPSEEQIQRCLTVLESAFKDGKFTAFLLGGDLSMMRTYHRCFLNATLLGGELYVAGWGSEDIQGVAMWFGPSQEIFSTEEQLNAGFKQYLATIPAQLREWYTAYLLPKFDELAKPLGDDINHSRWHLQLVGVTPEQQRKGIATALIHEVQKKADATHAPMKLETTYETNLPVYQKFGFEIKNQGEIVSWLGTCTEYIMVRPGVGEASSLEASTA